MSPAKHLCNAFLDTYFALAERYELLEGNDISDVESTETDPVELMPPSTPQSSAKLGRTSDSEHLDVTAAVEVQKDNAAPHSKETNTIVQEINTSDDTEIKLTDQIKPSALKNGRRHDSSAALVDRASQTSGAFLVNQDLSGQNRKLQAQIRELESEKLRISEEHSRATQEQKDRLQEAETRLEDQKAAAEMVRELESEKVRISNEHSRASQEQADRLQEAETRLEDQKAAAEMAAAAAERKLRDAQAHFGEELSTAQVEADTLQTRLEDQKVAAKKAAAAAERNLRDAQAHSGEELLTARVEADTLQARIRRKDSEIKRLKELAEEACEAKVVVNMEKNELYQAKVKADEKVEQIQAENRALQSQRDVAESNISGANGRAKGLEDLLKVTEKSADTWKEAYESAQEDARDRVLSAYDIATPEYPEENQQTLTTAPKEAESTTAIEPLREEGQVDRKSRQLMAKVEELNLALEEERQSRKAWENDIRRQCSKEKEEALAKARDDLPTSQKAAIEQDVRRECQLEMDKTLSDEREHIRVQWTSWAVSLRGQFAVNLKARTNEELDKSRRKASAERKKRSKVTKHQAKCVVRQAVSRSIEVERSLIQKELRSQFQTELSNYKTNFENEHAKAQTQSESQSGAGAISEASLHQEIYNRDQQIASEKEKTKQAYDDLRQSRANHQADREENQRLSQRVMAYESQEAIAGQSKSDPQIALTAQNLVRASKLLAEVAVMGLDGFHLEQLNELLTANKLIADLRLTIEDDQPIDPGAFQGRVDRLIMRSYGFDDLDARERPALHAQLEEAYQTVVCLSEILKHESGEGVEMKLLERIYRDRIKGKGKQGTFLGPGKASGPSFASNGAQLAPSATLAVETNTATSGLNPDHQPALSNTVAPPTSHYPNVLSSSSTAPSSNPIAAPVSQDVPDDISPAAALALQSLDPANASTLDNFVLDDIDWSDPDMYNLDVDGESFARQIAGIGGGRMG